MTTKWVRQLLYVRRDSHGHIVGIQEDRPNTYEEPKEDPLREPRKERKDAGVKRVIGD